LKDEDVMKGQERTGILTITLAIATMISWASAFVGIRASIPYYSAIDLALLRYLVASIVLCGAALIRRPRLLRLHDLPVVLLLGVIGIALYNTSLNYGEIGMKAAAASFIVASAPIVTSLLAFCFLHERLNLLGWFGSLLGFAGVAAVALGEGSGFVFESGAVFVAISAVCQATFFVMQKPYLRKYTPLELVTYAIWFATLSMSVFLPSLISQIGRAPLDATLAVIYLGIVPGAIGYFCWSVVLSRMDTSRAISFLYLVPFIALILGWVWLRELTSVISTIGGVVALLGVYLTNKSRIRRPAGGRFGLH